MLHVSFLRHGKYLRFQPPSSRQRGQVEAPGFSPVNKSRLAEPTLLPQARTQSNGVPSCAAFA